LDDVRLLAYYSYKWEARNEVGLKLSTMRDTDLYNQAEQLSWIEKNNYKLIKAVSHLINQRCNGHLILLWTKTQHLLRAFGSSIKTGSALIAELI